jgi:hypothetical protein
MSIQLPVYDCILKVTASLISRGKLRPMIIRRGTELWRTIKRGETYSNIVDARYIPGHSSKSDSNRYNGCVPRGSAYEKAGGKGSGALYMGQGKAVRAEAHHYHQDDSLELAKNSENPEEMLAAALLMPPDFALIDRLAFAFETRVDFQLGGVGALRALLRTDTEAMRALGAAGLGSKIDGMLISDDYSACRAVGHAMHNAGFDGLVAETARRRDHLVGRNVVLFGEDGQSFVKQLDPIWMLIANKDELGGVTVTAYPQKIGVLNRVGSADAVFRTPRS